MSLPCFSFGLFRPGMNEKVLYSFLCYRDIITLNHCLDGVVDLAEMNY